MIEHLVFNCQSSRVGPWDALSSAPEDRRRRTGVREQRSDRATTESQRYPQIFDRDPSLAEDALQRFRCNRSVVWNSYKLHTAHLPTSAAKKTTVNFIHQDP